MGDKLQLKLYIFFAVTLRQCSIVLHSLSDLRYDSAGEGQVKSSSGV